MNLASSYLASARTDGFEGNHLIPFTDEAVISLGEHSSYHPRQLINNLHIVLEAAVESDIVREIDKNAALSLLEGQDTALNDEVDPLNDFGNDLGFDE